jgi:hypothetical protein
MSDLYNLCLKLQRCSDALIILNPKSDIDPKDLDTIYSKLSLAEKQHEVTKTFFNFKNPEESLEYLDKIIDKNNFTIEDPWEDYWKIFSLNEKRKNLRYRMFLGCMIALLGLNIFAVFKDNYYNITLFVSLIVLFLAYSYVTKRDSKVDKKVELFKTSAQQYIDNPI